MFHFDFIFDDSCKVLLSSSKHNIKGAAWIDYTMDGQTCYFMVAFTVVYFHH